MSDKTLLIDPLADAEVVITVVVSAGKETESRDGRAIKVAVAPQGSIPKIAVGEFASMSEIINRLWGDHAMTVVSKSTAPAATQRGEEVAADDDDWSAMYSDDLF